MTVPSKADIQKIRDKVEKHFKRLNSDGSPKRKFDENIAKALFRSAVREKWIYSDVKLSFLLNRRIPDMNYDTRTKWLHKCDKCGQLFKESDIQVDHYFGQNEFSDWSQAQEWASKILDVKHEHLQILCITDHNTKSRCEYLGLDWTTKEGWNRGLMEQEYTKASKLKAKEQQQWLLSRGVTPHKSPKIREQQIRNYLESNIN